MKTINLKLSEINDGAIQEKFNFEMNQVFENILDLNTEATKKRTVTLTIDVTADKNRELVQISCKSKSKLISREETETKILFGRNPQTGYIEADGGLWKYYAMTSIKEYLESALEELIEQNKLTVIA